SDEEAQMSSFRFVHIRVEEPEAEEPVEDAVEAAEEVVEEAAEAAEETVEEAAEAAEETVEEAAETAEEAVEDAAEETAEETEAEPVEDEETEEEEPKELTEAELKAQDLAATLFEALSESKDEDLEEVAKAVDESIIVARGTFQTNVTEDGEDATPSYLNEEMIAAVRELKEGEITPIIETEDDGYYVAWLENVYDESATQSRRDSIISEREDAFYNETVDEWLAAAEISINDEVLSTLKVTDSMVFTMTSSAFDTEEIPEDELVEDELMEDGELADDEMVPVEGDELVEETAEEAPVEEAEEE
ncbi:MAG: peptidyl-prolyl cis-trans isomerase, partial [Clostridiales bacterium]|nr:peptidyl-prolyl cis-trans isomerase [Candidatus Blautia equi]